MVPGVLHQAGDLRPAIAVENLTVRAGAFALRGVSFAVGQGEYAVLMGKTGTGKTTLLEAVCGLKPVEAGSVRLGDRDVTRLKIADRGIGYVPQDRALFATMTVRDHLAFALVVRKWDRRAIARRVAELAGWLGLERLLDRKPHGLSKDIVFPICMTLLAFGCTAGLVGCTRKFFRQRADKVKRGFESRPALATFGAVAFDSRAHLIIARRRRRDKEPRGRGLLGKRLSVPALA